MSTKGLRLVGHFEQVLAAAIRDESHVEGVINPFLANAASRVINNPEFQRVKDRMQDDLQQQTVQHLDQQRLEHTVTNLAVDARINRSDLDYIVTNLQQPPPPPAPPPPPTDSAADRVRLIAELDGLAMERERQSRAEMLAQRNAMELAAQRVATVPQQIVREFHTQQPIYIPTPVPQPNNHTEMMRQMGLTMQQIFLQQTRAPDEIPITMMGGGGRPPPPPPGAGAVALRSGYGPARMAPERYAPFTSNSGAPPPPGGGTAPMPIRATIPAQPQPASARNSVPVRKLEKQKPKKKKPTPAPAELELEVETGGGGPPSAPSAGAARIRVGKRGLSDESAGPSFQTRRFLGPGHQLPDESFRGFRGPSVSAGNLNHMGSARGKRAPPVLAVRAGYQPFAGQPQRLDTGGGADVLRERAVQRMRELGHAATQNQGRSEAIDRQNDLQRAVRRGGAYGNVVPLGKRKRSPPNAFLRQAQPRVGGRPAGPQRFSIM